MSFAQDLINVFGCSIENQVHPHCEAEKSHLFKSFPRDSCSTEIEFLQLIHALVCTFKPQVCVETGTFIGYGTIAITSALKENGMGHLTTIELDQKLMATAQFNLQIFDVDLNNYVTFMHGDSAKSILTLGPLDFVFLDDHFGRASEFQTLLDHGKLNSGAIVVVHDTSRIRSGNIPIDRELPIGLDRIAGLKYIEHIEVPLSRGLRVFRYNP